MEHEILTGNIIGNECVLTAEELARACRVEATWIAELIDVGILEPQGEGPSTWRFCAADLICARRAARLQRDFQVGTEAVARMRDLLNEVDRLRDRLRRAGWNPDE
jgi:chaperone modulatory protein CbpM